VSPGAVLVGVSPSWARQQLPDEPGRRRRSQRAPRPPPWPGDAVPRRRRPPPGRRSARPRQRRRRVRGRRRPGAARRQLRLQEPSPEGRLRQTAGSLKALPPAGARPPERLRLDGAHQRGHRLQADRIRRATTQGGAHGGDPVILVPLPEHPARRPDCFSPGVHVCGESTSAPLFKARCSSKILCKARNLQRSR